MIDRTARTQLALAIRQLGAGRISTEQFDDALFSIESEDAAIASVGYAVDASYGDASGLRYRGDAALTARGRRFFAKLVMFLRSNVEYRWPELSFTPFVGLVRGLTVAERVLHSDLRPRCIRSRETMDALMWLRGMEPAWWVWPYASQAELRESKRTPTYLVG